MKAYNFVVIGLVALCSLAFTGLWADVSRAWIIRDLNYDAARQAFSFNRFPLEPVRERINGALDADKAISLGPPFDKSDFFRQRASEVFYPRLLDPSSPLKLVLKNEGEPAPENSTVLLVSPHDERVTLLGIRSEVPLEAGSPEAKFSLSGFFFGLLSILGFTFFFALLKFSPGESLLASALALGWGQQIGTWLQFPAAPYLGYSGWGLGVTAVAGFLFKKSRPKLPLLAKPDAIFVALLGFLIFLGSWLPVTLWDGRSIWLFHAKQIVLHGFSPVETLLNPELAFSHPEYPALWPAWLAQFSVFAGRYSERAVALGGMLLSSTVWMVLWISSRRALGKIHGTLFTASIILATETLALGMYADGLLVGLMAIAFLELTGEMKTRMGWIALACAASLKFEGFVFAGILFGLLTFKGRSSYKGFWIFLPTLAHVVWGKSIGLKGDFHEADVAASLLDFAARTAAILGSFAGSVTQIGYVKCHGLIWAGLAAVCGYAALSFFGKKRDAASTLAFRLAGVCAFVVFALFLVTPKDPAWHVGTAGDRLLLTSSMLSLLGLLRIL